MSTRWRPRQRSKAGGCPAVRRTASPPRESFRATRRGTWCCQGCQRRSRGVTCSISGLIVEFQNFAHATIEHLPRPRGPGDNPRSPNQWCKLTVAERQAPNNAGTYLSFRRDTTKNSGAKRKVLAIYRRRHSDSPPPIVANFLFQCLVRLRSQLELRHAQEVKTESCELPRPRGIFPSPHPRDDPDTPRFPSR